MSRSDFLLEIGSEEIPAGYLDPALKRLETLLLGFFREHGLDFDPDGVECFATPRRLAILVRGLSTSTPRREERKLGPPVKAAFDKDGNSTKAAEGFARKVGCSVDELDRFEDPKGERLGKDIAVGGDELQELLMRKEILREWTQLGFPKTMRWIPGDDLSYARPIRWIVCLLGEEVIPLPLADLVAGRGTWGHRTLSGELIPLDKASDYESALLGGHVIAAPSKRRELIEREASILADEAGGRLHEDRGLLAEVVNLVEHPRGILGSFDAEMAELLPREVIITAMRAHQRYFSVEKADGTVLPRFITFRDGGHDGIENVRAGNERVLRARLDDALFYWNEDRSASSDEKLARLDTVVWMEGYGSMGDKCRRIAELAVELGAELAPEQDVAQIRRAGLLCKSDLATEMIKDGKEFTKLQGIMGRYYALQAGEDAGVADAIAEHLRPRFADDRLPEGTLGTLVALADRLDAMAGCVLAGFAPTGSQDPYALRRQALAVLRILVEHGWRLDLAEWVARALESYRRDASSREAEATIIQLFWGRLETLLQDLPPEIVRAVLSVHPLDPVENVRAARDLSALQGGESFGMLVEGARRCRNILVKADRLPEEALEAQERAKALQKEARHRWTELDLERWEPQAQQEEAEQELVRAARAALPDLQAALEAGAYTKAYESLSGLGPAIDRYFTDVLVNAPEPDLRGRRLDWLESLHYLFSRFADLSRLPSA